MRIKSLLALFVVLSIGVSNADAAQMWPFKKKKVEPKETKAKPQPTPYQKFVQSAKRLPGLFTVYYSDGKCYFEIPASLLRKDMMISSKISASSNSAIAMAGEMQGKPRLIMFDRYRDNIILREVVSNTVKIEGQDDVAKAIDRNNLIPASEMFKVAFASPRDSSFIIDVTPMMLSNAPGFGVTPNPMASGGKPVQLSAVTPMFTVLGIQSFKKNINVRCRLVYKVGTTPFEAEVTRSLIVLPEKPMKGRVADPRMNYFQTSKYAYDMNEDKGTGFSYIHRWNLAPKPEDVEKYRRGELVEPAKPIVYYVDDAFPEKWKKYIKQGIEDWQIAFESIGFKNAIVAKDFPKDDKYFNPEDIRYSCFRYITVPIANAMGPSWVDPRSGEIIQGSVYLYHNVLQLVHNWMFTQTAAANPAVRARVFDEETMGRAMRYIASHEIGHTLGLMHNMKASAAYPVDSLRSATFTQKYGTTSSIMDYARFNFVAQPEDKGVSFTPPLMGEYDKFAIKIGYAPVFEQDEKPTIKKWFSEKKGQEMFVYGPQSFSLPLDPSAQSEDLGDDPVKASKYGIKNLKYIMNNLVKWTTENGSNLDDLAELYTQLMRQYDNHFGHVTAVVGGAYLYMPTLEEGGVAYVPVTKAKQKEAMKFLLTQIDEFPQWMGREDVLMKYGPSHENIRAKQTKCLETVMSLAPRVDQTNGKLKDGYSGKELLGDIYSHVWAPTVAGRNLTEYQRNLEYSHMKVLMGSLGYAAQATPAAPARMTVTDFDPGVGFISASSIPAASENPLMVEYKKLFFTQLNSLKSLIQSRVGSGDADTRAHYKYMLHEINKALSNN